ncbi:MAG TPA: tagaturonate epimerase family protein [Bacteroidota bacterium]
MQLGKFSIGIGDRFGLEGAAQLRALQQASDRGVAVTPVWNKSNREHTIIGTRPGDVRAEAQAAVRACSWSGPFHVDADHIGLASVDGFLEASDFFTIDVADWIGKPPDEASVNGFIEAMGPFLGNLTVPGMPAPVAVDRTALAAIARRYLTAVKEAGRVYRHILERKGPGGFITEVSFDEAGTPQTPAELFFILAAIAREGVPVQTIAPKFTGAFLKGVDYVGDVHHFAAEFRDDLAVVAAAPALFGLPPDLKLSIHTGSDKFSLYPVMHRLIREFDAGVHLKTAGTTWLEELIGLAAAGGEALALVKEIYNAAVRRFDELCAPYRTVIDIDTGCLPSASEVRTWASGQMTGALRHDPASPAYNRHFRQLLHVSFRVAAEMGGRFREMLTAHRAVIERNVTANIFDRHLGPLFLGPGSSSGRKGD